MAELHLSRVAYGCTEFEQLEERLKGMADASGRFIISTRNKPKRADEVIGGGLYFIIKHMLAARVEIVDITDGAEGRVHFICKLPLQRTHLLPKRAHQGWRYLQAEDAPAVLEEGEAADDLPPHLIRELSALMLL
jgi:hypothetical protein